MLRTLYTWLAADIDARTLRELGWFDFATAGHPVTTDARVLAAATVYALLVDASGTQIRHDDGVVYAVLGFVEAERGGSRPTKVSAGLLGVLHKSPVTQEAIEKWFTETYP